MQRIIKKVTDIMYILFHRSYSVYTDGTAINTHTSGNISENV